MKSRSSRTARAKSAKPDEWPRKVQPGRTVVRVYRRMTPSGNFAYMVANYADSNRRRFDSYASEADALAAADALAKRLDKCDYKAANLTEAQAVEYVNVVEQLSPLGLSLSSAVSAIIEAVKLAGDLPGVIAGSKQHGSRHKKVTPKRIYIEPPPNAQKSDHDDVVTELLKVKESRGAAERYLQDLRIRLTKFGKDFQRDACNVTTADVQAWLDRQTKLSSQSYANYRRVVHLLFKFAVARGYASENPVEGVERVKVRNGEIEIFTPDEITRLLAAASEEFLPCLAIGAFAGLRSAELERLEWSDVRLADKLIVVGASKAKTAGRRIVPIHDNLAEWLAPYCEKRGRIWTAEHDEFYEAQQETANATAVTADPEKGVKEQKALKWKANALRHSYASYRFALTNDAGRVAGELGNSAAVVHRHYRELVTPADAARWFAVKPAMPANVTPLAKAANG